MNSPEQSAPMGAGETLHEVSITFDWPDLPSPAVEPAPYVHHDLPSFLQPWDPAPIRALHGFARKAIAERAHLALTDPTGELEAVAPMSGPRARWILLTMAEQDAARPIVVRGSHGGRRPDDRELRGHAIDR